MKDLYLKKIKIVWDNEFTDRNNIASKISQYTVSKNYNFHYTVFGSQAKSFGQCIGRCCRIGYSSDIPIWLVDLDAA